METSTFSGLEVFGLCVLFVALYTWMTKYEIGQNIIWQTIINRQRMRMYLWGGALFVLMAYQTSVATEVQMSLTKDDQLLQALLTPFHYTIHVVAFVGVVVNICVIRQLSGLSGVPNHKPRGSIALDVIALLAGIGILGTAFVTMSSSLVIMNRGILLAMLVLPYAALICFGHAAIKLKTDDSALAESS